MARALVKVDAFGQPVGPITDDRITGRHAECFSYARVRSWCSCITVANIVVPTTLDVAYV